MSYVFSAFDSVRSILGVSSKELPDTVLSNDIFTDQLRMELLGVDEDIFTTYDTVVAAEATTAGDIFLAAFRIYAAHALAFFCLTSLPIFSPKSVTDGKAGFSRYADSPFKETKARVETETSRYRKLLIDKLAVYQGGSAETSASPTWSGVSSPTLDPVTGE